MPQDRADKAVMFSIIGLVAWAIVALPVLSLFQSQRAPEQPQNARAQAVGNTQPEEPWLTKDAAGFFTFILVIVGIGQLGLFYWQLRYMREAMSDARMAAIAARDSAQATQDAVEVSRDTAVRQLRAYIHISDTRLLFSDGQWQPNFRITIKNFGQTPARLIRHACSHAFGRSPNFALNWKDSYSPDLGPGEDFVTTMMITQAEWKITKEAIEKNAGVFYVYGEVEYFDGFSKELRKTGYRSEVRADAEGVKDGDLFFSSGGNYST